MTKIMTSVLLSVLVIVAPVTRYIRYHKRQKQIENDAKVRGAALSENEREALENCRAEKELSLKYVALACAGAFIILLGGTANM